MYTLEKKFSCDIILHSALSSWKLECIWIPFIATTSISTAVTNALHFTNTDMYSVPLKKWDFCHYYNCYHFYCLHRCRNRGRGGGGVASDATGLYNIPSVSFTNAYNTSYAAFKQWLWQFRYPLFFDWKQRRKELCLIQNTLSFKATLDRQRSVISAECPDISTVINKE